MAKTDRLRFAAVAAGGKRSKAPAARVTRADSRREVIVQLADKYGMPQLRLFGTHGEDAELEEFAMTIVQFEVKP